MLPPPASAGLPAVTAAQMADIDRRMIEDLGVALPMMMEHAGAAVARLAMTLWNPQRVTVLAGTGGNGGGALVAARHLVNRGVGVAVTATSADRMGPVPTLQLTIANRLGIPIEDAPTPGDVIIDGIIGYSLSGDPRQRAADLIEWANSAASPIISVDIPSGLTLRPAKQGVRASTPR